MYSELDAREALSWALARSPLGALVANKEAFELSDLMVRYLRENVK